MLAFHKAFLEGLFLFAYDRNWKNTDTQLKRSIKYTRYKQMKYKIEHVDKIKNSKSRVELSLIKFKIQ